MTVVAADARADAVEGPVVVVDAPVGLVWDSSTDSSTDRESNSRERESDSELGPAGDLEVRSVELWDGTD